MPECCGGGKIQLMYACSGCSDVGEISDKTARALSKDGFGKMTCLAGVGARLSGFIESAKAASENIVVDGCSAACAKNCLEQIGVTPVSYILTDMGLVKRKTPVTEEIVNKMCEKIKGEAQKTKSDDCISGAGNCRCG